MQHRNPMAHEKSHETILNVNFNIIFPSCLITNCPNFLCTGTEVPLSFWIQNNNKKRGWRVEYLSYLSQLGERGDCKCLHSCSY